MINHERIINPAAILAVLFLSGCAAGAADRPSLPDRQAEPDTVAETVESPPEPTPDEVIEGVLAGELLGSQGATADSAEAYVTAALASDDPALASRATEISIAAETFDLAVIAADHWVQLAPQDEAALQSGIIASLGASDASLAEHYLGQLLDLNRNNPERAFAMLVAVLPNLPDEAQAAGFLQQMIAEGSLADSPEALQGQSRLAAELGDTAQARQLADEAIEAAPGSAEALIWAGRLAALDGDNQAALDYYQRAYAIEADRETRLAIAELHKRLQEYRQADRLLAQLDTDPGILFTRLAYALEAEDRQRADSLFTELQKLVNSGDTEMTAEQWFYSAQAASLIGDDKLAIDWYRHVDTESGFYVDALIRKATLEADQGDVERALKTLEPLQNTNDAATVERGFLARSELLRQAGQLRAARQTMSLGLTRLNRSIGLLYGRGILSAQLEDVPAAESDFRRVLELDPGNIDALNALGYTLTDLTDRHEEAYNLIRQAHDQRPDDPAILDSMGWVLFKLGRPGEALPFLQQAWAADHNPEIAAHLGEVLWVLGERQRALGIWAEGVSAGGDDSVLVQTLDRLGVEL